MKYRVRVVFNAPLDREHPFVSVEKDTLEEAQQIIEDMRPAILVHAVSVTIQRKGGGYGWETMSSLDPGTVRNA